jgi:hypothetical protein
MPRGGFRGMVKRKDINLLEAQNVYENIKAEKRFTPFKVFKCPRNCRGRKLNNNQCTPDNCIKLNTDKKAVKALKIATGEFRNKTKRIDKEDMRLLDKVTMYDKLTSNFHYRNHERPEIKKQLKSLGMRALRLTDPDKRRLKLINETREKLGLRPLSEYELKRLV